MDQNRPDDSSNSTNHQQNVHLHMHHVCACQGVYPAATTYYPPLSYRTPLIPYATTQSVAARPYLQHYQYTQFNVGGQYNMSMSSPLPSSYGTSGAAPNANAAAAAPPPASAGNPDCAAVAITRDRRTGSQESVPETDRSPPEPPTDFDFSATPGAPIIPPVSDLFLMQSDDLQTNTDNFIKFLERSCLTAEQIAYRNRNRPCFRNIQNLCIRTRSEILKPRTTISNIHSQGIPWATKDFIYAFVRLTNCWHILKGYWENREGSALGKIEKELTPGFKACYVRWEKETVELATELTRIFYNLDVNQTNPGPSSSSTVNLHHNASTATANNLIPAQVSLLNKSNQQQQHSTQDKNKLNNNINANNSENINNESAASLTNNSKNVRGILHLPQTSASTAAVVPIAAETVDQGNQTCFGDFSNTSTKLNSNELGANDDGVVYMKPGSYLVPKKFRKKDPLNNHSPRVIEFLETAQNINKGLEAVNDKYWVKFNKNSVKKSDESAGASNNLMDIELNSEVFFNVHEWLSNSNFSDYGDQSNNSTSPPRPAIILPNFLDEGAGPDEEPESTSAATTSTVTTNTSSTTTSSTATNQAAITVLQRKLNKSGKSAVGNNGEPHQISSRTYRRTNETINIMVYEMKSGGLTKKANSIVEKILSDLKSAEFAGCSSSMGDLDLEMILKNFNKGCYRYINEIVRDLRQMVNSASVQFKTCEHESEKVKSFSKKIENCLVENFPNYDFSFICGKKGEKVGKLKYKNYLFDGDYVKN